MGSCCHNQRDLMMREEKKKEKSAKRQAQENKKRATTQHNIQDCPVEMAKTRNLFGTFRDWNDENPPSNLEEMQSNAAKQHIGCSLKSITINVANTDTSERSGSSQVSVKADLPRKKSKSVPKK